MAKIGLEINKCRSCPLVEIERTPKAGYAFDYFCSATSPMKLIASYVEYPSEIPEVPDWCPILCKDKPLSDFYNALKNNLCEYDLPNYHSFKALPEETLDDIAKEFDII